MEPAVCDGQDPARSTLCGRDIDLTLPAPPGPDALHVTVFTLLTWYKIPVRQSGGCRSTTRYHIMCVMVKGFFSRRYADAIWIQGWDLSIMQHGFSKASFGRDRHHRRLEWSSYGA